MTPSEVLARTHGLERPQAGRSYIQAAGRLLILATALLIVAAQSPLAAAIVHGLGRLAYVFFVGFSLRGVSRLTAASRGEREARFTTFRRNASLVMEFDGASLVALVLVTAGWLEPAIPVAWVRVLSLGLIALGIGCKLWAARTLDDKAYYWHDFFVRPEPRTHRATGPYRWFRNPMYTVGYAHAYGLALLFLSWPGLFAALFDQAAILAFHGIVERPHVKATYDR